MNEKDVIYDWNVNGERVDFTPGRVALHDETLRDGIQCPSAFDPSIDEKLEIVRLLDAVGIDTADIALPGAGPRAVADCTAIVECIRDEKLNIKPTAAARTHPNDIRPIIEISQKTGVPIEVMTFLGSSPIRLYAENWDEDRLATLTRTAMKMSVEAGLPTSYVTEDTVRSKPATLERLFNIAVEEGATCLILCDTVGHATPNGTYNLIRWTDALLRKLGVRDRVAVDWHGHNDRGLSLMNSVAAIEAGADRIHGTILGIGERVGNCSIDQVMVNLKLMGSDDGRDLRKLGTLVDKVADAVKWDVPVSYPVFGRDAFRTGTGVHAAAVIKAQKKGDHWLADRIYSGVPAGWFGREQEITIGHQSGLSNIRFWLEHRNIEPAESLVQAIFDEAKKGSDMLPDSRILEIVAAHTA